MAEDHDTYVELNKKERKKLLAVGIATKPVAAAMLLTPLAPFAPFVFVIGLSITFVAATGIASKSRH